MLARDGFAFVAAIDWTPIVVALITLVGVLISVAANVWVTMQLRTPSGTSVGKQVESAHLTSIGNSHRISALAARLGVPESVDERDDREQAQADG